MADNSLQGILGWMKNPQSEVMWGWDIIAVMDRRKINGLLLQDYIARFSSEAYLSPITDAVQIVHDQWKEYIHDFLLDAPRLSFEQATSNNTKATLACLIMAGVQVTMKREFGNWLVEKLVEIDPLQGPKLFLDLNLAEVAGIVESDGRIYLDLRHSDNFRLTFGPTEQEQQEGGRLFRVIFNALPPEKRIWVLGRIEGGTEAFMQLQSFELRTQANPQGSSDPHADSHGDGAVLVLISTVDSRAGGTPPDDYPYLIPDDVDQDYSAAVLFEREQACVGTLVEGVAAIIQSHNFIYAYDGRGHLASATETAGQITVPAWQYWTTPIPTLDSTFIIIKVELSAFTLPVDEAHAFVIRWDASHSCAVMDWQTRGVVTSVFSTEGKAPVTSAVAYSIVLSATYELMDDGVEPVTLQRTAFSVEKHFEEVGDEGRAAERSGWAIFIPIAMGLVFAAFHDFLVKSVIELALKTRFAVSSAIGPFIQEHVKLNFGKALEGDAIRAPRDIGFFGRINPTRASFQISPLQPLMAAGGTQPFTTEPVVSGLTWTVTALPGCSGDIGSVTANGLYQAPAASAIEGRFVRVRVTASESASGYNSSALVTVLVNGLTINPLIQRCDAGRSVELKAGALGGVELRWEINNPVEGESGRLEPGELYEGDRCYVAAPRVTEKTYVLDEIEVTHTATGAKTSVWVLAVQKEPMLKLKPLTEPAPLPPGQLRLEAILNGHRTAEWSLPMGGPGSISLDNENYGLYCADPQASERFVLIFAKWDTGSIGIVEGHIILPLPMDRFADELELLCT
jgi:hypothetical protein